MNVQFSIRLLLVFGAIVACIALLIQFDSGIDFGMLSRMAMSLPNYFADTVAP